MTCAFLIGAPDILLTTEPSTVAMGGVASTGGMYARQTEKKRRQFVMRDKLFATLGRKISCRPGATGKSVAGRLRSLEDSPRPRDLFSERSRSNLIIQT